MNIIELSAAMPAPDLLERWRALALATCQADPCCCAPAWNMAYHKIFHPGDRAFAAVSDAAQLSFSETCLRGGALAWLPLEDSWMFSQPLLGFDALNLLKELLFQRPRQMPVVVLGGVREDSSLSRALFLSFSRMFNFYRAEKTVLCAASLEGGLDGWLSRRSGNFRAKLKKARRNARHLSFERHTPLSEKDANDLYARMLAVEERSWKGINHCGMAERPSREFYGALINNLAKTGAARVIIAKDGEKDIGYIFGSRIGPYYRGQQFSFDQDYATLSPGNLMQAQKIAWLCEEDVFRYDMGPITGPRMEYKQHWTEIRLPIVTWIMRPL